MREEDYFSGLIVRERVERNIIMPSKFGRKKLSLMNLNDSFNSFYSEA